VTVPHETAARKQATKAILNADMSDPLEINLFNWRPPPKPGKCNLTFSVPQRRRRSICRKEQDRAANILKITLFDHAARLFCGKSSVPKAESADSRVL
jgi:hypothetical protein